MNEPLRRRKPRASGYWLTIHPLDIHDQDMRKRIRGKPNHGQILRPPLAPRHGSSPLKIMPQRGSEHTPRVPQERAVPVQKDVRCVCTCVGSAPRYACSVALPLRLSRCCRRGTPRICLSALSILSVCMYGQGLADERQGHSCIASPLSPSSFDDRPRPRMERGTPGTSPLGATGTGGEAKCLACPHGTRPIRGSYS